MQKILLALSIGLIILSSCNSGNKKDTNHKGYTIHGTISNSNSSTIYLLDNNNVKIDSLEVNNDTFLFKGNLESPKMHSLQLKNQPEIHSIALENSTYNVFVNDNIVTVSGGILNTKQLQFNSLKETFNSKKLALLDAFVLGKMSSKVLHKSVKKLNAEHHKIVTAFLSDNADNILSTDLFLSSKNFSLKELQKIKKDAKITDNILFNDLLDKEIIKVQKKVPVKLVKVESKVEEKKVVVVKKKIRKPAILFSGDGLNDDLVSLKEIIKGKKIILVDFWASWCTPCRESTPKIRELYKKYKSKGFTVLTVSEDKTKEAWRKGLEEDNMLDWYHIYDDYGRISSMHGVRAIPYMILIDGEGKIIKEKASLSQLERELIYMK